MSFSLLPRPKNFQILGNNKLPVATTLRASEKCYALACGVLGYSRVSPADSDYDLNLVSDTCSGEAYCLSIVESSAGTASIILDAKDATGIRNGLYTLQQLLLQSGDGLPALTITDSPAFAVRGAMLDVSRDRVPRMDELFRLVDQLASFKYNHLQLYTEHTFAYAGHEEVWKTASPITAEEIRALDSYCLTKGITLAANQNTFGHMERWLKHPKYAHLAETHDFWEWGGRKIPGPFSLAPLDPGSIELVQDLLLKLLPNFSSKLVNIGCDEALDVGQGRTREAVKERGEAEIYYEFVRKVAQFAEKQGFRPMYWADIALSHPESLQKITDQSIALAWGYEPDAPFEEWVRRYNEIGQEVWVSPGTSSWRSITGRTSERRGNIAAAAALAGRGANGFLVTDWGDAGHRQQWPVALAGLAEAAENAWNGAEGQIDETAISLHAFDDKTGAVSNWLAEVGDADLPLRKIAGKPDADGTPTPLINSSVLFNELGRPLAESTDDGRQTLWSAALDRLEGLKNRTPITNDSALNDELAHTIAVAIVAAKKALWRRQGNGLTSEQRELLANELSDLVIEHRRLWLLRSRPGGLDDSCAHYIKVIDDLRGGIDGL